MKNKHKVFALAIILTAIATNANAQTYDSEKDFKVEREGKGIRITEYLGSKTEVRIPPSIQKLPVISIGVNSFYNKESLTSITIPNSVTSIGERAFESCTNLTSINIPDSVTSIGSFAFYGCTSLATIKISNSITSIRGSTFLNCTSLTSVTIPDGVTSIGSAAFRSCTSLISVIIPKGVTSIGEKVFLYCTSLIDVTISNSVTSIGELAFGFCAGLTGITIPDSVTSIENNSFYLCNSLTAINVAANNSAYNTQDGVLYNKNKTVLIIYPAGKTSVSFTIPNSVTDVSDNAFYGCNKLTNVIIPKSVTSIGNGAFYNCTSLVGVTFEGTIHNNLFYRMSLYPGNDQISNPAFLGDLRDIFYAGNQTNGTPGTYRTTSPVGAASTWKKQ